ncbi:MAG: hypothetical protein R3B90_11260 [Planctomycetaceae bacterium]|jgi:hypothetical protein
MSMRLLSLTLLLFTGCQSLGMRGAAENCGPCVCVDSPCYRRKLDDWHTTAVAKKCANKALLNCPGVPSCDYRDGFTQAYVDVAQGSDGTAPPVPAEQYWGVCGRTGCGHQRAADWYAGYNAGAARALANCQLGGKTVATSGASYAIRPTGHAGAMACSDGNCSPW